MIMSETHDVYVLYQISNNYFVIDGIFIRPGFFLHPIQYSNLLCLYSVWHEKALTLNYHPAGRTSLPVWQHIYIQRNDLHN